MRAQARRGGAPGPLGCTVGDAVTRGGSWARRTVSPDSDIDIGLYNEPDRGPDFDELYVAIVRLDDRGAPDGHGRYGDRGPWIDGGVGLRIDGRKTDLLLRDLRRVEHVLRPLVDPYPEPLAAARS